MKLIALCKVHYVPKVLEPGILYVSDEYHPAAHLCMCGCGAKVVTPLGPAKWAFWDERGHPSLWPSIGNWQLPCRSHYVIRGGKVLWAGQWSDAQVDAGRARERTALEALYKSSPAKPGFWISLWKAFIGLFQKAQ